LRPTGLSLPWFDMRAEAEALELRHSVAATPRAGIAIGPDRTAAKWLWLRRKRPSDLRSARQWIALTDYPAVWWSGAPFMSGTLAPRTACYDVYARRWIEPLLEASGAPSLPDLINAGAPVGTMRPGPLIQSGAASSETLVVAGGHDHPTAAAAIRRLEPAARVDSMGTANLVYGEATGPVTPYLDPFMAFSVPLSGTPGLACLGVMELSAALAPAREDSMLFDRIFSAERLPGEPMLVEDNSSGGPEAAVRRVLEDVSFHARRMFAAMDAAGAPPGPIFATGGWARSRAFLELRASIFGQPIQVIDEPELTAIGAAFLAFEAANGTAPRLEATRCVGTVDPVAAWSRAYDKLYPAISSRLEAKMAQEQEKALASASPEPGRRTIRGGH
jgi:xylulokinase